MWNRKNGTTFLKELLMLHYSWENAAMHTRVIGIALVTHIMETFLLDRVAFRLEPHHKGTCDKCRRFAEKVRRTSCVLPL